jgi:hypothetical protein
MRVGLSSSDSRSFLSFHDKVAVPSALCVDFSPHAGVADMEGNLIGSRSVDRGIGITLILHVDNLASVYEFVCRERLEVLAQPLDEYLQSWTSEPGRTNPQSGALK